MILLKKETSQLAAQNINQFVTERIGDRRHISILSFELVWIVADTYNDPNFSIRTKSYYNEILIRQVLSELRKSWSVFYSFTNGTYRFTNDLA